MIDRDVRVLHLEPTDVCQADCPLCARETDPLFDKNKKNHLTYEQIKNCFPENRIQQLEKMFMCGVYGDPAAGKNTLDIYKKFRDINPTITLGMNTNGGLRSKQWWAELANIFNQTYDYVVFSIDGLRDTNHLYRINVNWDIMIENISVFIENGGSAHWDMLIYQHNQHQVEEAKQLADKMGFTWFRAKVSKRPETNTIKHPDNWRIPKASVSGKIDCAALKDKSVYIDARGFIRPCCWLGDYQNDHIKTFDEVQKSWHTKNPNPVCQSTCGITNNKTTFDQQWSQEIQIR